MAGNFTSTLVLDFVNRQPFPTSIRSANYVREMA